MTTMPKPFLIRSILQSASVFVACCSSELKADEFRLEQTVSPNNRIVVAAEAIEICP
jgi:hypothetical protein